MKSINITSSEPTTFRSNQFNLETHQDDAGYQVVLHLKHNS